jgi:hypothetical protein
VPQLLPQGARRGDPLCQTVVTHGTYESF